MTTGTFPYEPGFPLRTAHDLCFSPDESVLFVVATRIERWDVATGTRTHTAAWSNGSAVDVSPDGRVVLAGNTSGDVVLLDADTLEQRSVLRSRDVGEGPDVRFGPGGTHYVQCSWSGHVIVRETESGKEVFHERDPDRMINVFACSPDRQRFASSSSTQTDLVVNVRRWPFDQHAPLVLPVPVVQYGSVNGLAFSPDGRLAILATDHLAVWDVESAKELERRPVDAVHFRGIAWGPRGELVAIDAGGFEAAGFLGFSERLESRWAVPLQYACAAAYSPSGALLALGTWEQGMVFQASGAALVAAGLEPLDEEPEFNPPPDTDDDESRIRWYVQNEANELVVGMERTTSRRIGTTRHDVWDVETESGRWWAITNPLAAYDQADHRHDSIALTFHIGTAAQFDDEDRPFQGEPPYEHWSGPPMRSRTRAHPGRRWPPSPRSATASTRWTPRSPACPPVRSAPTCTPRRGRHAST